MTYKIRPVRMDNAGNIIPGKRKQSYITPQQLRIGGLYFLRPGRLYRVEEAAI